MSVGGVGLATAGCGLRLPENVAESRAVRMREITCASWGGVRRWSVSTSMSGCRALRDSSSMLLKLTRLAAAVWCEGLAPALWDSLQQETHTTSLSLTGTNTRNKAIFLEFHRSKDIAEFSTWNAIHVYTTFS